MGIFNLFEILTSSLKPVIVFPKKLTLPTISDLVDNFLNFVKSKEFEISELSEIIGNSCENVVVNPSSVLNFLSLKSWFIE